MQKIRNARNNAVFLHEWKRALMNEYTRQHDDYTYPDLQSSSSPLSQVPPAALAWALHFFLMHTSDAQCEFNLHSWPSERLSVRHTISVLPLTLLCSVRGTQTKPLSLFAREDEEERGNSVRTEYRRHCCTATSPSGTYQSSSSLHFSPPSTGPDLHLVLTHTPETQ